MNRGYVIGGPCHGDTFAAETSLATVPQPSGAGGFTPFVYQFRVLLGVGVWVPVTFKNRTAMRLLISEAFERREVKG